MSSVSLQVLSPYMDSNQSNPPPIFFIFLFLLNSASSPGRRSEREREDLKNTRLMNYSVLKIQAIPSQLAHHILQNSIFYFSRFGNFHNINTAKVLEDTKITIHVTYESVLSAAVCLLAFRNSTFENQQIKSYFGTSRYCHLFLNNKVCYKENCFYYHYFCPENDYRLPFHSRKNHYETARQVVKCNMNLVRQMKIQNISSPLLNLISVSLLIKKLGDTCLIKQERTKGRTMANLGQYKSIKKEHVPQSKFETHCCSMTNLRSVKKIDFSQQIMPGGKQLLSGVGEVTDNRNETDSRDSGSLSVKKIVNQLNKRSKYSRFYFAFWQIQKQDHEYNKRVENYRNLMMESLSSH